MNGVEAALSRLQSDTQDFWASLHSIHRIDASTLTPIQFYRDFVSRSVPVVLLNVMTSTMWQSAMANWQNNDYLIAKSGEHPVSVNVTPFGFGDAVMEFHGHDSSLFVLPEERSMHIAEFLENLKNRDTFDGVPYLSHQNDNLRDQLPNLFNEIPSAIELGVQTFGNEPEAVNIWIGDERAVSTLHKDHYENIYCVVKGQKHFTLLPPSAVGCLYEQEFPTAKYCHVDYLEPKERLDPVATKLFHEKYPQHNKWMILSGNDKNSTPWIPVDPLHVDLEKYPMATTLQPIEVVLEAGEVLYLPSLWYHRATQLSTTISVNYWHDMEFDCRYVYYNFAHEIGALIVAPKTKNAEDKQSLVKKNNVISK
ncbi:Predicted phospholipase [Plasmopara halstedii]|uniref:Predicted phospholipase n=1 Tax=Plasmopara halstedii TaxID=4781 RepID=A0A0P1A8P4_PLAHL|nr:Predicted phospholipase [Plasmopara halstedii]CEG37087.1 Predicted phospholipase [Plasmopara halstedii]|eukprot:XP_024573456.1 Predicted phospholipase [Plasmopara halstedii]